MYHSQRTVKLRHRLLQTLLTNAEQQSWLMADAYHQNKKKMKGKNLLMIGAGAVVLYFVWKNMNKKLTAIPETIKPPEPLPEPVKSLLETSSDYDQDWQLALSESMAGATGGSGNNKKDKFPCYCNGNFAGYMSHKDCVEKCVVERTAETGRPQTYVIHRLSGV